MAAEANFKSVSDGILRETFQAYAFLDEWKQLKGLIVQAIAKFHKDQQYDTLSEQVFFSTIGQPFREQLNFEEKFEPTNLREPFILKVEREYLHQSIHHNLVTEVTAVVLSSRDGNARSLGLYKLQPLVEDVLNFYREKWKGNVFFLAEVIGATLLRTMHRSEFQVVREIMSPDNAPVLETSGHMRSLRSNSQKGQTPASLSSEGEGRLVDSDTLLNSYRSSQDSISQVYSLGLTSKEDYVNIFRRIAGVSDEVSELLDTYSVVAMDSVCGRIVGSLLCNSMRVSVWAFRFLHRPVDRPVEPNHFIGELHRLGSIKDIGMTSKSTPVSNTVKHYIQSCLERAFPTWLWENGGSAEGEAGTAGTVLARRAEHLVNALYVMTGIISERGVMIAILLLRVFHDDSPVSEKMLRMYSKIVEDYWPSDHPNSKYSLIYTNNLIWNIIKKEDAELFQHLKEHVSMDPDEGEDIILPPSQEWNRAFGGIFKEARKELPLGMALVKGWLETGFLGWLPEFGVIFIWDQLALLGGTPSQNQRFVARLCAQLLKLLRDPLLDSTRMFASVIRKAGRLLRSKDVFNLACEALILYTDDIPLEERLENEEARDRVAALSIQKACRGYLARLRAKLIRRAKESGNTDRYLSGRGDFHSYQWMRKLSLQTDRSRAYQLQEMERFNRSTAGRSALRMANSRSECIIDVYGPPAEAEERPPRGFAPPELSPSSRHRRRGEAEAAPSAAGSAPAPETPDMQEAAAEHALDGSLGEDHSATVAVNSETKDGSEKPDGELLVSESAPQNEEQTVVVAAAAAAAAETPPETDGAVSALQQEPLPVAEESPSAEEPPLVAQEPLGPQAPQEPPGEQEPPPIAVGLGEAGDSSGNDVVSAASAQPEIQDSSGFTEADPLEDLFARSLIGAPAISAKIIPVEDADPPAAADAPPEGEAPNDAEAESVTASPVRPPISGPAGEDASLPAEIGSPTGLPATGPLDSESGLATSLVFPPLEPALQEEVLRLSLSTVSLVGLDLADEKELYALPHDDPLDYVSLGSLPRSSVSPVRGGSVAVSASSENEEKSNADGNESLPQVNPAPSLYGFFLSERESIREDYYRLEEVSKEIQKKKRAFEEHNGRFMSPDERVGVVGELDRDFAEVKLAVERKAIALRQKELALLSKWSGPHQPTSAAANMNI